ncbi:MAG: hypothetical protein ABIP79_08645 [Chitinophagaceae bacterium]
MEEVKIFPSYPSASGIEKLYNKFYIIGDDAKYLLILDSSLHQIDSISLFPFSTQRISKSLKADLESISITKDNKLLLLGSGSASPYRNVGWLISPFIKEKTFIHLDTFYQRLHLNGIKELNIEGSCTIPGGFLLANRGNKNYPNNKLIITTDNFWEKQRDAPISTIAIGTNNDSSKFSGVSGICYSNKSDQLILSVSTEETYNTVDDGTIGKSYLWIVKNLSSKKKWKAINPEKIIDLEGLDHQFKGQKIESVCIAKETSGFLHLILVADNDNGASTIFRVVVEKD